MTLTVRAHAKLNLTLEVLGKRPDGFHELRSLMCNLALHDVVHLETAPELQVRCTLLELDGPANLAFRAAELLRAFTGHSVGARITVEKAIPVAAGLGGGSADAAAVLVGLNRLWDCGLDTQALRDLAAQLGSDVPFCVVGGAALAAGRGEILRPIPTLPEAAVLLVCPPFAVSTAQIYGALAAQEYGTGEATERFILDAPRTPPVEWRPVNSLEPVTCRLFPVVRDVLELMRSHGAPHAAMCGSGPSCFALFASAEPAEHAAAAARARGWDAWVTHITAEREP
ncbi:MAG: 4-(cytidine 5'-diphospho)-2-C-methyl-D-erythritol kinase [Chloroflexota bacterium]